ncbi:hypothetical protein AKO1_014172, partial [Acrasis kona]
MQSLLLSLNVCAFFMMARDKFMSKSLGARIPETVLLICNIFGGVGGAAVLYCTSMWYHNTKVCWSRIISM